MLRRSPAAVFIFIGLLSCASVQAADPAPAAASKKGNTLTLGGGKPTGVLTRNQLRQCLQQQKTLQEQDAEAGRAQAALQAEKADIARQRAELEKRGQDLEAERATVDATKAEAVDAFNAKLAERAAQTQQYDAVVGAYNAKLAPLNAQIQTLETTRLTWLSECGNRSYDEADFFAIQRGK